MSSRRSAVAMLAVIVGCAAQGAGDGRLAGKPSRYYTCCNLRFNPSGDATDANYAYAYGGTMVPAGTRVSAEIDGYRVRLTPEGGAKTYTVELRFARGLVQPDAYFRALLRDDDPRASLLSADRTVATAIEAGASCLPGMTRAQAIMARGYPPLHQTSSIESDDWIYYESAGFVSRVHFSDGVIASIAFGDAP